MPDSPREAARRALHAPFRPRLARVVALVLALVVALATPALVLTIPGEYGMPDLVGFALVGGAIVWFCWRQASVRLQVDEQGLSVRNLMLSRRVEWAQVVSVRFGQGRPWVQLDLADGDFAAAEASRLATLVALHTRTARND